MDAVHSFAAQGSNRNAIVYLPSQFRLPNPAGLAQSWHPKLLNPDITEGHGQSCLHLAPMLAFNGCMENQALQVELPGRVPCRCRKAIWR